MMCLNQKHYRRLVMLLALVAFVAFSGLAEAAPWRFAVLGDQRDNNGVVGVNTPVVQAMVNDIVLNRGVSLALVGGDQIHGIFPTPPSNEPQARLPVMYRNWRAAADSSMALPWAGNVAPVTQKPQQHGVRLGGIPDTIHGTDTMSPSVVKAPFRHAQGQ
jgi:hypothetical protein